MRKYDVSPTVITRYVGNRWNLLFTLARTILLHQQVLHDYLENFCKKETMRKELLWGITDNRLLSQLKALALVGLSITTPWMQLFYANEDRLSNLEMVRGFERHYDLFLSYHIKLQLPHEYIELWAYLGFCDASYN